MAKLSTARECPYCSSWIQLGDCPIVATGFEGDQMLDEGPGFSDPSEVKLHSGKHPERVLPGTGWPVLKEPPRETRVATIDDRRGKSSIERAFSDFTTTGGNEVLLPLAESVAREHAPARACPQCHCPLPASIDQRSAIVVAVVGVNRVGKTHLLASSLSEAYRQAGLRPIGCNEFEPDENTGSRFMEEYYTPLFRHGKVLGETPRENPNARFKPFVFDVTIGNGKPFSLVMHDISGEDLGDRRLRARHATYLHTARGVIFVVDPRDIDDLRDAIVPLMPSEDESGWDQGTLLAACLREGGMLDRPRPVPLAVVIAKADLLPQATGASLPFLSPVPAEEDWEGFYRRVRAASEQVEGFLERYRAHNILDPARRYEDRLRAAGGEAAVTFHAVSALGNPPAEIESGAARVRPINCLDPLAAILSQI